MAQELELKTLRCGVVAWMQTPPLPLNSGTDKAKLLNFTRPQFPHLKIWQKSHFSGYFWDVEVLISSGNVIICKGN